MVFRVEIAPLALSDIDSAYLFIKKESAERAVAWLRGVVGAIYSLEKSPGRCPVAAESSAIGRAVRVLIYGKRYGAYKIFFSIHAQRRRGAHIRVFHVRHGARKRLQAADLADLITTEL
jgi:plasmid stabilization system protein ParE